MNYDKLTREGLTELLSQLVEKLDELDEDDFFGSEGWRHYLDLENEPY